MYLVSAQIPDTEFLKNPWNYLSDRRGASLVFCFYKPLLTTPEFMLMSWLFEDGGLLH